MGFLPNNSFIVTNANGGINEIHCSSGSQTSGVGQLISPNEQDITYSSIDPFDVIVGDIGNPGSLIIRQAQGHSVTATFNGMYTCVLPDENGMENYIHFGLYPQEFMSMWLSSLAITVKRQLWMHIMLQFCINSR